MAEDRRMKILYFLAFVAFLKEVSELYRSQTAADHVLGSLSHFTLGS